MGRLTVDTSEAQSFEAVEPGPYYMTVDEIDTGEDGTGLVSEKGSRGVFIYYKFEDPNLHRYAGRTRRWYSIDGKGAGFFREVWKGITGEEIPMDAQIDVDPDDAIGRRVLVKVKNESYEGRLQNVPDQVTQA